MRKLSAILLGAALAAVPVLGWAQHTPNSQKKWAWLNFERPAGVTPVISPRPSSVFNCPMQGRPIGWEESETFNPAATIKGDSIIVLYRAEDNTHQGIGSRTSRLGYAASADGIHFNRRPQPVFYPDNDSQAANEHPGGCEDPRVAVTEDGVYVMFYTQWNHKYAQLAVATSRDLLHWTKHGPVFGSNKRYPGTKYTKSASILTKMKNGRQVITKLNGKYVMFWGEYFVNVATSDDLIHWTPTLDDKGNILKAMSPRRGYFDSMLTECGPPALLTKKGILLFYNGKNSKSSGDPKYTANAYCAGQALFSSKNPNQLLDRLDEPFFKPELDFEKSGQYPAGTVFIEGLVPFHGSWYLYYGCADSRVSVAIRKGK